MNRFGAITKQHIYWWAGPNINSETPPPSTDYWPCPRGALVTLDTGTGDPPTEFQFSGGVADGPKHCNGNYRVTDSGPGKMTLDANAGTNSDDNNAFDVKIEVSTPSDPGGGGPTANISGTAMTHKSWGFPAGKQDLDETGKVTQTANSDGSTTYSVTIDAKDGDGDTVPLTLTWTPYHPC